MAEALQVEYLPIADLIPYARNSRTHSDEQIQQLAGSIREFGFTNPILISEGCDIIAGHGRALAAAKLGMSEVPCIRLGYLTETQRKAYVIADNRLALNAGWDAGMLKLELLDLKTADFELDLLGFEDKELEKLLAPAVEGNEGLTDPDEVPESAETRCKPGDLWVLGKHRLLCGDSTNVQHVERLMAGEKAEFVYCDPPYGMKLDTDFTDMQSGRDSTDRHAKSKAYRPVEGDAEDYDPGFLLTFFAKAREIFLWGADYYAERLPSKNDGSWVVWDKRENAAGSNVDKRFGSQFELCWSRERHRREIARIMWAGAFGTQQEFDRKRCHPTQKPTALAEWFFERWGKPEDLVADLFLGSGSTLIACEKTGRRCFGMEIDPHYCDVILTRWEKFTGQQAKLEARDDG